MSEFRTCASCGRIIYRSDADEQGNCIYCRESGPEAVADEAGEILAAGEPDADDTSDAE